MMSLRTTILAALFTSAVALGAHAQGTATQSAPATPSAPAGTATNTARQPSAAQQAQQERMRTCNAEAGTRNLQGDARRSFMSECLAGRMPPAAAAGAQPSAAQQAQQNRMRDCNAQAGTRNLAGEARQTFMAGCLRGN